MSAGTGKARKFIKAAPLAVIDVAAVVAAYLMGMWGDVLDIQLATPEAACALYAFIGAMVLVTLVLFTALRMYNTLWEYASVDELVRVVVAVVADAVLGCVLYAVWFGMLLPVPAAVTALAVMLVVCGASRFLVRLHSGRGWSVLGVREEGGAPRSLIVGAGETGALTVTRMLAGNPDMPGCPVVLVDDDPDKQGERIRGVKVCGTVGDIPALCGANRVEQIVVAVPSATPEQRKRILDLCVQTGLKVLTLPNVRDIPVDARGRVALREVEISDLLPRDEIKLDLGRMGYVAGKRVLVTGGGGSIGSEIVRQLLPARPALIVLFDIYENTTYELYHEVRAAAEAQGTDLRVVIGSIVDVPAITATFDEWRPDVVFHAAAHKHVPLMEACAREAVQNNVMGTRNVARLAHERGCSHFILVSTDKAVNPTNVMGATKRMCEMVVHYYSQVSPTVFAAVRFGNVLGSHGSVIPLFRRQMREGGPITLTHPDITRYFMTIPEASRLVIAAGALAEGGETFILKMGEPVRIYDLAVNLVRLSGLRPGKDIEIKVTGLRPGEKLFEELQMDDEEPVPTDNDDIMVSTAAPIGKDEVAARLCLLEASLSGANDDIKRALAQAVPTYRPQFKAE